MRTVTLRLLPPLLLFRLSACAEPPPSLPPASPIDWGTGLSVADSAASSACCASAWLGTSAKAFDSMVGTQYTEFYWWHSGYDSSDGSWVGGTYPSCTSQWLSFEFNDPVTLSGYRITSRGLTAYAETDSPKGWALQWSVNGSPPWITVQRVTDEQRTVRSCFESNDKLGFECLASLIHDQCRATHHFPHCICPCC